MSMETGRWFGPGEMAKRLGVTPKALRIYEREGLVAPSRTEGGWRAYGPAQVERLHQIIALRDLGLSLKRIKDLLSADAPSLLAILALQQQALEDQRRKIDRGLSLLVKARDTLAAGHALTLDDLTQLTRETVMQTQLMSEDTKQKLKDFIRPHVSAEEMDSVAGNIRAYMSEAGITKEQMLADVERLMIEIRRVMETSRDANDPELIAAYRRWYVLVGKAPRADKSIRAAIYAGVEEAAADPELGPKMPFDVATLAFIKEVVAGMKARGEFEAV